MTQNGSLRRAATSGTLHPVMNAVVFVCERCGGGWDQGVEPTCMGG